jgi:hypothetical protein
MRTQAVAVADRDREPAVSTDASPTPPPPRPPRPPRRPARGWCAPEQHVWLQVPKDWRCECGEMEIVDNSQLAEK